VSVSFRSRRSLARLTLGPKLFSCGEPKVKCLLCVCLSFLHLAHFERRLRSIIERVEAMDIVGSRSKILHCLLVAAFPSRRVVAQEDAAAGSQREDRSVQSGGRPQHEPTIHWTGEVAAQPNEGMKQTKPSVLELRSLFLVFAGLKGCT